jgi:DNA-binding protein H-NS
MNLKAMSVDKLTTLLSQVDAVLTTKVAQQKLAVHAKLANLGKVKGTSGSVRLGAGGTVAPKYRNPENPSETWAGRGLKPRWLSAALKSGKKLEHFLIEHATKATAAKPRGRGKAMK